MGASRQFRAPPPAGLGRLRIGTIAALVLGLLSLGTTQAPAQFVPAPDTPPTALERAVEVRGNRRIEAATIRSFLQLPSDRAVTAADLNAATRRLFDTGLFRNIEIVPTADGRLVISVVENPSINSVVFEGNSTLDDDDLQGIVSARPRFPFTAAAAEADAQAIIETYRRTGRFGAEVTPVVIERAQNRVDLVFEIDEGEVTGINSIDFIGNKAFSDSRLREEIETRESGLFSLLFSTDIYDPDRIELDKSLLRQFYLSRGYADFTLLSTVTELAPDRSGFFVTFNLDEGPEYTFGTFDVVVNAEGLDAETFLAELPDLEGETYDASEVDDIANTLTDLAGAEGFAFVRVQPRPDKDTENLTIDITFELIEGERVFIERIDILGNTQTLDRVIRREIELVEGDPFDARKIRRARQAIRGLDFFQRVDVRTEPADDPDRAILEVEVVEKSTGSLALGLGFASSVGPIGTVSIQERNFLGRGQEVNFRISAAGDTQVYDFQFIEPRFLDRDLRVGQRLFFIQDDREDESSFQLNRFGYQPEVGFPLGPNTDLRIDYQIVRDDLDAAPDASPAIQIDDGVRFKSSLGYRLVYDARNDPIEPTGGYLVRLDQEFAGLGGDAQFVSTRGRIKGWQGLFDDFAIASVELEAGTIFSFGDDTQVNDRFFLGGDSFRGFADEGIGPRDFLSDDAVGGNSFGVVRAEVSFPLGLPEELGVFGGFFLDAGTVFGLDRTDFPSINRASAVSIDDGPKLRVAAGALLFVTTPFGPLALSAGVPLLEEDGDETEFFRLSVGTRF